jgi:hypothetical protein
MDVKSLINDARSERLPVRKYTTAAGNHCFGIASDNPTHACMELLEAYFLNMPSRDNGEELQPGYSFCEISQALRNPIIGLPQDGKPVVFWENLEWPL